MRRPGRRTIRAGFTVAALLLAGSAGAQEVVPERGAAFVPGGVSAIGDRVCTKQDPRNPGSLTPSAMDLGTCRILTNEGINQAPASGDGMLNSSSAIQSSPISAAQSIQEGSGRSEVIIEQGNIGAQPAPQPTPQP